MNPRGQIPKALIVLKQNAGDNWEPLKKYFNKFLDYKRDILNSNLSKKNKKVFEEFVYDKYFKLIFDYVSNQKCDVGWDRMKLYGYSENVLTTFWKSEYRSDWVCYVNDSQNKCLKTGNKKYPYANPYITKNG